MELGAVHSAEKQRFHSESRLDFRRSLVSGLLVYWLLSRTAAGNRAYSESASKVFHRSHYAG